MKAKMVELQKETTTALEEMKNEHEKEKASLKSLLVKLESKYDASKEEFTNVLKNTRKELITEHENEIKNIKSTTEELESQIERDKLTISRMKCELDKEREIIRCQNKEFEKYKKKAISEKKQVKRKLEDDNKSKSLKLKDLETEIKKCKEEESKALENVLKLKAELSNHKDVQEQLRDELIRWRTLPGSMNSLLTYKNKTF